jgi:hypothetical protein
MSAKLAMVAALVAAVTLTSVASARPGATKQRVALTVTILPSGKGALTPLKEGALKPDSGSFDGVWSPSPDSTVVRDGMTVEIYRPSVWTFAGKAGSLVLRERAETIELGQDLDHNNFQDGIGMGTWKVVRGTGLYAGITGGGRSAHFYQGHRWVARFEGFLTVPKD